MKKKQGDTGVARSWKVAAAYIKGGGTVRGEKPVDEPFISLWRWGGAYVSTEV